ncbi:Protein painting of fourth [Orchesella cincta]|uniref:Protein painting of fourth n=1 Tax=Orchesella cincta TaxID=48709 RepID=A0A1D2NE90_ORCCI|nr:Protein painting of fourth [Orchesella cincta]
MVIEMKAKNKGRPQSLPGTPGGKGKGSPKKAFTPKAGGGGGGGAKGPQNKGKPGDNSPTKQQPQTPKQNKQSPQQQKPQGISAKLSKKSPGPKTEQNGNSKPPLKQLDAKSKAIAKPDNQANAAAGQNRSIRKKNRKASNKNQMQRFNKKISEKIRTPQSCARALKAEQELTSTQGRILKITLPDPVVTHDSAKGWSNAIETVLFARPVEPRSFTVVLQAGANVKKEIEKLSKVAVGNGKLTVKEHNPAELGHTGGHNKDPADLIDPYTLYVTNLPESINKPELEELFKGATVTSPRKHNPKMGTSSKFAFVAFETAEAALTAFKENFNKKVDGKSIIMRFRRLSPAEQKQSQVKETPATEVKATPKAAEVKKPAAAADAKAKKQQAPAAKGKQAVKQEPVEEDDEDDDDDDEDDDEGMEIGGEESDDDEDDDDDDLEDGDDDDDDDDDDDEDDE